MEGALRQLPDVTSTLETENAAPHSVEVNRNNLREVLAKFPPGEEVPVKLLREGGAAEVSLRVGTRERTACRIRRAESPTPPQKRLIDAWLGKKADY